MPRKSPLSVDDKSEMRRLYAGGMCRESIREMLAGRGIVMTKANIYYHLGLRTQKPHGKCYMDYLREDYRRRGLPFSNPRPKGLWS